MQQFKSLQLEDKELFETYLRSCNFTTSEYSFINLYIWREGCEIAYAVLKDTLIIKKKSFDGSTYFMQPIGYKKENLRELVVVLMEWKEILQLDYLFGDVEESFLKELQSVFGTHFCFEEDRDNFDYIYDTDKLATLSGKKLHSKKNHYNYFTKNFSYTVKEISDEVAKDCIIMAEKWYEMNMQQDGETDGSESSEDKTHLQYELDSIRELLMHRSEFNYQGLAVYVDDKLSAFTIGEQLNEQMAVIHVEKADPDIHGIYTFINKTFVERYYKDVTFINREQDLGILNLRKAKESYHPVKLEPKYKIAGCKDVYMQLFIGNPIIKEKCNCV